MSDHHNNTTTMISSFLGSPRFFFNGFFTKNNNIISDHSSETPCNNNNSNNLTSPTSILDTKNSSMFKSEHHQIGLAIIDSFIEAESNRTVLFGSKLRVHIPVLKDPISPVGSPKSPADFGIKTRNVAHAPITPTVEISRQLSLKEMELSEDYTRVITHGPNPKTTHIYDDCVVESSYDANDVVWSSASTSFMSFCHTCKMVLGHDRDIFIYRGEKAFCSEDCRCQEIVSESTKNPEFAL